MAKRNPQVIEVKVVEEDPQNDEKTVKKVAKSTKSTAETVKNGQKSPKLTQNQAKKYSVGQKILLFCGILAMIGGIICAVLPFLLPKEVITELHFPEIPSAKTEDHNIYSRLTGMPVASMAEVTAPTYCVQIPNGTDGARPQVGLDQAGVVFEAIAEAGITRFAAIYQNPTSAVIGPVRSLRLYYLQWDAPFDCTIVHAGGAADAVSAVRYYRDLTENYTYMYRGTAAGRRWNNLFTTAQYLADFNKAHGYDSSDVQGFSRMTNSEAEKARVDALAMERLVITEPAHGNTSELKAQVGHVALNFGRGIANFNVVYDYDVANNRYMRSYASGVAHEAYVCPSENLGEKDPEKVCTLEQVAPTVVIAMVVEEGIASDNYHEEIKTTGTGVAYVFQNGTATRGTWVKGAVAEQIKFFDESGAEIKLVPGQTFISAIPGYGGVEY